MRARSGQHSQGVRCEAQGRWGGGEGLDICPSPVAYVGERRANRRGRHTPRRGERSAGLTYSIDRVEAIWVVAHRGKLCREGGWGYLEGIGLIAGDVAHNSDHAELTSANNAMHLQIMVLYLGLDNLALLGAVTPCHTLLQKGLQGCSQNCLCHLPG